MKINLNLNTHAANVAKCGQEYADISDRFPVGIKGKKKSFANENHLL